LNPNHGANQASGRQPPWAGDRRLLEALDLAADRTAIAGQALSGAGRPARGLYPRALAVFATRAALPAAADPAAARRLLDAEGWRPGPDGIRTRDGRRVEFGLLGVCGDPDLDRELELLRQQWLQVGAAADTGCADRDAFFATAVRGAFDMTIYSDQ